MPIDYSSNPKMRWLSDDLQNAFAGLAVASGEERARLFDRIISLREVATCQKKK